MYQSRHCAYIMFFKIPLYIKHIKIIRGERGGGIGDGENNSNQSIIHLLLLEFFVFYNVKKF